MAEERTTTNAAEVGDRIRKTRESQDVSMSDLARRSGVAKSTLSDLEAGRGNPTLATLNGIAQAINVAAAELIGGPQGPLILGIERRGDSGRPEANREPLDGFRAQGHVEVYELAYALGHDDAFDAHAPGAVEHVMVHSGRMRVGPVTEVVELGPGDAVSYRAHVDHVIEPIEGRTSGQLIVSYPAPQDGQAGSHGRASKADRGS